MTVLETDRLLLRHFTTDDAEFILKLVNEPSFIANIGDREIRTVDQASTYLSDGPIKSYERHGHGLYLVALKGSLAPIGICGLLKRDAFQDIDLGYAFLAEFWSQGFALESASAVLEFAARTLGAPRIIALVSPENRASIKLLEKLGFAFTELRQLKPDGLPTTIYTYSPASSIS
ncbi:MAG TPA: GNAT family N-acetyltransferase [Gemmatimonadaceae bacterium]